jgi:hypothetical protein
MIGSAMADAKDKYVMIEDPAMIAPDDILIDYYHLLLRLKKEGKENLGEPFEVCINRVTDELKKRGVKLNNTG